MIIVAHPDDPEFFCGGTIALWCAAGTQVSYLILTNGNKGSDEPEMTPEKLIDIRQEEQHAAANVGEVFQQAQEPVPDLMWRFSFLTAPPRNNQLKENFPDKS